MGRRRLGCGLGAAWVRLGCCAGLASDGCLVLRACSRAAVAGWGEAASAAGACACRCAVPATGPPPPPTSCNPGTASGPLLAPSLLTARRFVTVEPLQPDGSAAIGRRAVVCARWNDEAYRQRRCPPHEWQRRYGTHGFTHIWTCVCFSLVLFAVGPRRGLLCLVAAGIAGKLRRGSPGGAGGGPRKAGGRRA